MNLPRYTIKDRAVYIRSHIAVTSLRQTDIFNVNPRFSMSLVLRTRTGPCLLGDDAIVRQLPMALATPERESAARESTSRHDATNLTRELETRPLNSSGKANGRSSSSLGGIATPRRLYYTIIRGESKKMIANDGLAFRGLS